MQILTTSLLLATLPSASPANLDPGRELRQQGKIEEAISFFRESLAVEPASPEALQELGHSLVLAGRYHEALEAYGAMAASEDLRWQLEAAKWNGLAQLYLGDIEASLEQHGREARLAAQLGEGSAAARAARHAGHVYAELSRFGEANKAFLEALEHDPDSVNTLYLVGVLAARQGDWGSLRYQVMDLETAVSRSGNPDLASHVDHLKAELALSRGDGEEALELLEEAGSKHILYRETLARAYRERDDLARAEATYRSILDATDERLAFPLVFMKALLGLAEVLDAQEREEEAVSFYHQFLDHWEEAADPLPGVVEARGRLQEIGAQP